MAEPCEVANHGALTWQGACLQNVALALEALEVAAAPAAPQRAPAQPAAEADVLPQPQGGRPSCPAWCWRAATTTACWRIGRCSRSCRAWRATWACRTHVRMTSEFVMFYESAPAWPHLALQHARGAARLSSRLHACLRA